MDFFDESHITWADKPRMLMVHGFGGCGAVFYKMIKHLRYCFRITTIDLLGMGGSG